MNEPLTKTEQKYLKWSLPKLKKKCQEYINEYIRLRDRFDGCISCSNGKVEQAGHFIPVGTCDKLRFNLDNIHGQCLSCNYFKGGNYHEYRKNLINKIGKEKVEKLEQLHQYYKSDTSKWDKIDLILKIREMKRSIKKLK